MKENEFYDLVLQMRNAQKENFRTRSKSVLECSKELERKVDAAIAEHEQPQLTFEQECAEGRFVFDPNGELEDYDVVLDKEKRNNMERCCNNCLHYIPCIKQCGIEPCGNHDREPDYVCQAHTFRKALEK